MARTRTATKSADVTTDAVPATGTPEAVADKIVAEYASADRSGKAKIRKAVNDAMLEAVTKLDVTSAAYHKSVLDRLVTVATKSSVPVDPRTALVIRIAALRAAADGLESGAFVPATTGDESPINVADLSLSDYVMTDADKAVVTDYAGRIGRERLVRTGRRNSLTDHIADAVRALGADGSVVTVRAIATFKSDSLPDGAPSDGAIAARLFPMRDGKASACTVPGIVPVDAVPGVHPRGARLEDVSDTSDEG